MADIDAVYDGVYSEDGDRGVVTFQRAFPVPAEELWAAVSTTAGLRGWFPSTAEIDVEARRISFSDDPQLAPSQERIIGWQPPHRLSFEWAGDVVELTVDAEGDASRLVLRNELDDEETAAMVAAGWHVCLDELGKKLAGAGATDPHGDTASAWQPLYESYIAAGFPSGAEIPGRDA